MGPHDPLDIRAQEEAKDQRDARSKLDQQNESEDFKWLMSSKRGRRIVWRQLERAGVFRTPFNTNAMLMAHACGEKNEGLKMLAQVLQLCPERFPEMLSEQAKT